MSDIEPRLRQD